MNVTIMVTITGNNNGVTPAWSCRTHAQRCVWQVVGEAVVVIHEPVELNRRPERIRPITITNIRQTESLAIMLLLAMGHRPALLVTAKRLPINVSSIIIIEHAFISGQSSFV